jgi:hypothetical protein
LTLHCPFCHASEGERLEAKDEDGEEIVLLMFDCPFYFRFYKDQVGSDDRMQETLDAWKLESGEAWLESVGPIMKERELKNVERYETLHSRS